MRPDLAAEWVQHSHVRSGTEDLVVVLLSVHKLQLVHTLLCLHTRREKREKRLTHQLHVSRPKETLRSVVGVCWLLCLTSISLSLVCWCFTALCSSLIVSTSSGRGSRLRYRLSSSEALHRRQCE